MGTTQSTPAGPDLAQGIPASDLPEGRMLAGHVGEEAVLLATLRRRDLCDRRHLHPLWRRRWRTD